MLDVVLWETGQTRPACGYEDSDGPAEEGLQLCSEHAQYLVMPAPSPLCRSLPETCFTKCTHYILHKNNCFGMMLYFNKYLLLWMFHIYHKSLSHIPSIHNFTYPLYFIPSMSFQRWPCLENWASWGENFSFGLTKEENFKHHWDPKKLLRHAHFITFSSVVSTKS